MESNLKNIRPQMNRLTLSICLIVISVAGHSQIKFEKEERIKKDEVPENAIRFVDIPQMLL